MKIIKTAGYEKLSDFNEDPQTFMNRCLNIMDQTKQVVANLLGRYRLDINTYKDVIQNWDEMAMIKLSPSSVSLQQAPLS